jgi:hypothetical protein
MSTSARNTIANNANTQAHERGYKQGQVQQREAWKAWYSNLPHPLQVALVTQKVSPESITFTQHKNGSLTIKVIAAPPDEKEE